MGALLDAWYDFNKGRRGEIERLILLKRGESKGAAAAEKGSAA